MSVEGRGEGWGRERLGEGWGEVGGFELGGEKGSIRGKGKGRWTVVEREGRKDGLAGKFKSMYAFQSHDEKASKKGLE